MKKFAKQTSRAISDILDSDDDLPDFYEETAEIPAYLNDSRFDHIELPWLTNCKPVTKEEQTKTSKRPVLVDVPVVINDKEKSKILISKGTLSTRNLFFVKSIEENCSEATLLWFINLLKNKSDTDRFHKSCLASNIFQDNETLEVKPFDSFNADYYFNLVVFK